MAAQTYEGKPCKRCHEVLRYQCDNSCVTCKKAKANAIPYEKRKAAARKSELKAKYGITPEQYERISAEQGGVCFICQAKPEGKALAVDHDHQTGAVRGLLCSNCNTGYGLFGESRTCFERAILYGLTYTTAI